MCKLHINFFYVTATPKIIELDCRVYYPKPIRTFNMIQQIIEV